MNFATFKLKKDEFSHQVVLTKLSLKRWKLIDIHVKSFQKQRTLIDRIFLRTLIGGH